MKMKQKLSFLLSAVMVLTAGFPNGIMAAESTALSNDENTRVVQEVSLDLPDSDELFQKYVDGLFFGEQSVSMYGNYGEDRLEGKELNAYLALKEYVQEIASGEESNSVITLSLETLGITKISWSASELGVDEIVKDGNVAQEAMDAWMAQNVPDITQVLAYLLSDCPLDLYWFDKTSGVKINSPEMTASSQDGGKTWLLIVEDGITYQFPVAVEYQDMDAEEPDFTVNAAIPRLAQAAADSAKEIVKKYEGHSDFEKLDAYREEICNLVSYNYEAAENSDTHYGNPWQLIWVFDGDDTTSVVCEGYAKAFQYLCDLSAFRNRSIQCYTVTGVMAGGTGAGGHMWNVVTMDDNKNYLVDITNCDSGTIGEDNKLFLAAAVETAGGYAVTIGNVKVSYLYDADMTDLYGDILKISSTEYEVKEDELINGSFGDNLIWNLDQEGNFIIEGTGNMPSIRLTEDIPWNAYRGDIKSVVVGEGITSIGETAFFDCELLSEVSLPKSLELIAPGAFAYCTKLDSIKFEENVAIIEVLAFYACVSLKEVVIPSGVVRIGDEAFGNCKSLKDVWFSGSCPLSQPVTDNGPAFLGSTLTLHYPNEFAAGWEELIASGFGTENITWSLYCINHTWESDYRIDAKADCTTEGSESIHCISCAEVKDQRILPATGHRFETVVTKATTSQNGSIVQKCSVCGHIASSETIYAPKSVTLAKDSYQCTNKALTPAVTVSDSSGRVISSGNYTVSYSNNTAVGTAVVSVAFQGNYSGTLTKTFVINPKGTSVSKLKAKAKGFEVKWKKQTAQTTGYQIQYALNKKFKGAKTVKIAKNKTVKRTVSKLKSKKKYYVRIRTYKTVKGVTYYSSWSAVKNVKTK